VNGVHDMGGMHGFGAVDPEPDEPVFHADWERRAFALTQAMGATGEWSLDAARSAREDLPPAEYLSTTYYERWVIALERLLVDRHLVAPDEIAAARSLRPARPLRRILAAADVPVTLGRPGRTARDAARPARFGVGERVVAKNVHPTTHTRLPRYVRGHTGTVAIVHGCHVFPDSRAQGGGEDPQWLYTVLFEARELWGPEAEPSLTISIDAFEPYLDPAPRSIMP
jgi:nitrile hydratase subunit beta